jgi:hypothetical protein
MRSGARIRCEVAAGSSIDELLDVALADGRAGARATTWWSASGPRDPSRRTGPGCGSSPASSSPSSPRLQGSDTIWRSISPSWWRLPRMRSGGADRRCVLVASQASLSPGTTAGDRHGIVAAGIMLAGTLAINALFPIRPPAARGDVNSASLNSIQGAQNQADPFGAIPVVLGGTGSRRGWRPSPTPRSPAAISTCSCCCVAGYGPLLIEDIRIGETPLSSYTDYEIDVLQGYDSDPPTYLYRGNVDEVPLSIQMDNTVDGPGVVGTGGDWQTQTTSPDTDAISVDFTATQGCFAINDKGAPDDWRVPINVRYGRSAAAPIPRSPERPSSSAIPRRIGVATRSSCRRAGNTRSASRRAPATPTATRSRTPSSGPRSAAQKASATITFPQAAGQDRAAHQGHRPTVGRHQHPQLRLHLAGHGLQRNDLGRRYRFTQSGRSVSLCAAGAGERRPVPDAQIDIDNLEAFWADCVANGWVFDQVVTVRRQRQRQAGRYLRRGVRGADLDQRPLGRGLGSAG